MSTEARERLYHIWSGMKYRCSNPKCPSAKYYYEKGIRVCDEWRESFECFMEWSEQNGYKIGLTIDRVDPNGDYEPCNCEWVTRSENSRRAAKTPRTKTAHKEEFTQNQVATLERIFRSFEKLSDNQKLLILGISCGLSAATPQRYSQDEIEHREKMISEIAYRVWTEEGRRRRR